MFKKFFFLATVSAFVLTLSHCTKKQSDDESDLEGLETSLNKADQEIKKMINKMSDVGYQDKESITNLLKKFDQSNDKFERFQLCSPILMAKLSYDLRETMEQKAPELTQEQLKIVESAKAHCNWATQTINEFEESLTDKDFKAIAEGVPNSLVPLRKGLFSSGKKCSKEEFLKLTKIDRERYTDTKVLGSILIMGAIQTSGNIRQYIPNYKKILGDSQFREKDFLEKFLDYAAKEQQNPRATEQKKQSLLRATKAFSQVGIKNIPNFLMQSMKVAPNCFSSTKSGVIDIAKLISTADRMKLMYARLIDEVKKSGDLPKLEPVEKSDKLKNIDIGFLDKVMKEKIATRDKWFRPFMVVGDKNGFILVSSGKDRTPGTEDDLRYPLQ